MPDLSQSQNGRICSTSSIEGARRKGTPKTTKGPIEPILNYFNTLKIDEIMTKRDSVLIDLLLSSNPHCEFLHQKLAKKWGVRPDRIAKQAQEFSEAFEFTKALRMENNALRGEVMRLKVCIHQGIAHLEPPLRPLPKTVQTIALTDQDPTVGRGNRWGTSKPLQDSDY